MTHSLRLAVLAVVGGLVAACLAAAPIDGNAGTPGLPVIVQAPGAEGSVADAVRSLGGIVTTPLPIINGFAATVPSTAVSRLANLPGVRAVTEDSLMRPAQAKGPKDKDPNPNKPPKEGKPPKDEKPPNPNKPPKGDEPPPGPPASVYRQEIGADALQAAGHTGQGVRVALIDTGVTEVADLDGRIHPVADPGWGPAIDLLDPLLQVIPDLDLTDVPLVDCVNFSGEATCADTFGHGTFMAGLIAGDGTQSPDRRYQGVAPEAEIVSVKVGGADGSADVSKVLAGIQWAVSFADVYDIRVLNLSMGTDSTAPTEIDPLNLAVQRAWVEGITVVVSAGNHGTLEDAENPSPGTITKPGDDPYVITVGAVDDVETEAIDDDRLPAFSSWGPTAHGLDKPDIVAPGARLISLRAPNSYIDAIPDGVVDEHYRRGSGTSMSAAVVSGLAAQLLDAKPDWQPDDVKAALVATARPVAVDEPRAVGHGIVEGPTALDEDEAADHRTQVQLAGVLDLGDLDASRGEVIVETCGTLLEPLVECILLIGEQTAQGRNWHGLEYAASDWTAETWYLSQWALDPEGRNWHITTWAEGRNWHGRNWHGSSWDNPDGGETETDDRIYGTPIDGSGSYGVWG